MQFVVVFHSEQNNAEINSLWLRNVEQPGVKQEFCPLGICFFNITSSSAGHDCLKSSVSDSSVIAALSADVHSIKWLVPVYSKVVY